MELEQQLTLYFNITSPATVEEQICILFLLSVVLTTGIIGNTLTIYFVITGKEFHTPTYITICCLSFADLMALSFNYTCILVYPVRVSEIMPHKTFMFIYLIVSALAVSSLHVVTCHVIMFAVVRYLILVYPFWSRRYVTIKAIFITSICLWIYGAIYATCHIFIFEQPIANSFYVSTRYFVIIDRIVEIVLPLILVPFFHCMKIRHLRKSPTGILSNQAKRMLKVTSVIACSYFVTMIPMWTMILLITLNTHMEHISVYMIGLSCIIYLLNFVINPLIYFLFTPIFRTRFIILWNFSLIKQTTGTSRDKAQKQTFSPVSCEVDDMHQEPLQGIADIQICKELSKKKCEQISYITNGIISENNMNRMKVR